MTATAYTPTRTLLQADAVDRVMDMIDRDLTRHTKRLERLDAIQESIETMLSAVSGVDFPDSSIATYHNITSNGVRLNRTQRGDVVAVLFDPDIDGLQGDGVPGPRRELRFHDFTDGEERPELTPSMRKQITNHIAKLQALLDADRP